MPEITNAEDTPKTPVADTPQEAPAMPGSPREILNNAFMLGWQIVELKSRIQIARVNTKDFGITQSSVWRSIVNKIAMMQMKAFPDCTTAETLYEPPSSDSLPYLYPQAPDYANVGIPKNIADGKPILENFKLYDVTRRAINCLTLLYIKEQESLIPNIIRINQHKLVKAILDAAENTGEGGGDTAPDGDLSQPPAVVVEQEPPEDATQFEKDMITATDVLTKRAVKFLDAWDGFLRENYYAGGLVPHDDSELIAYEAGRSMALLPWSISVLTVPYLDKEPDPAIQMGPVFITAWQDVFRQSALVRLQHQISSLSSLLDDSYYNTHDIKRPEDDQVLVMPNPDLPSQGIMAVKHSLDYWQNMVEWIWQLKDDTSLRRSSVKGIPAWCEPLRVSLIEQANIWQTLVTGQQSLRAFSIENVTQKLMEDVTKGIQVKLHSEFKGGFKQVKEQMGEMAAEVKDAVASAGKTAVAGVESLYKSFRGVFWMVGITIGLVVLVFVLYLFLPTMTGGLKELLSGGAGFSTIISAVLGYLGFSKVKKEKDDRQKEITLDHNAITKKVDEKSVDNGVADNPGGGADFLSRVENAANETGKMVMDAFQRGYQQIKIELSGLSRSAAVSYPLIEFFGTTFKLESDDDFLTEIIWSGSARSEQMRKVMAAAFGPLALFILPSATKSDDVAASRS